MHISGVQYQGLILKRRDRRYIFQGRHSLPAVENMYRKVKFTTLGNGCITIYVCAEMTFCSDFVGLFFKPFIGRMARIQFDMQFHTIIKYLKDTVFRLMINYNDK